MSWVIQTTTKSRCSTCDGYLDLLSSERVLNGPMFYICWMCRRVIQVGKGDVKRD